MAIRRLNHAVLYVADAGRAAAFYTEMLGFEIAHEIPGAAFLRAAGSPNDHDLGLFSVGSGATAPAGRRIGLYHLAWQVDTIDELARVRERLRAAGAWAGESDHGRSKSVYARDPDGNEFEVMWAVPRADWPDRIGVDPLDLATALTRWSGVATTAEANPA